MGGPTAKNLQSSAGICLFVLLSVASLHLAITGRAQAPAPPAPPNSTAQQPSPPAPAPAGDAQQAESAEVNTHDSAVQFRARVSLVPVRVVVRDAQGRPMANLHREDFRLFEDGKPQNISLFSIEAHAPKPAPAVRADDDAAKPAEPAAQPAAPAFQPPSRFVGLLFDDAHLNVQNLLEVRAAASRFIDTLQPTDRVALFTVSGQNQADFTDDRARLHDSLGRLMPRSVTAGDASGADQCPVIDYYMADLILNKGDARAITVAIQDTIVCQHLDDPGVPPQLAQQQAQGTVLAVAQQSLAAGNVETEYAFRRLEEIIRRVSTLPGERSIVLISPGFLYPQYEWQLSEVIDRATRASVFVDTLDARGLYTVDPAGDIAKHKFLSDVHAHAPAEGVRTVFQIAAQAGQTDVLKSLADGTGGLAFYNNNDLDLGFRTVAATPEVAYLLGFTPTDLKYDGRYHTLKVTLATKEKVNIQARHGFFAPKRAQTVEEAAQEDIEDAIFSQEEQHGLPVALHTQYYLLNATDAKLAVLTHVDIARMRFEKTEGRNWDDLTIVAALFDRNGNLISATQEVVEMRLLDATLDRLKGKGLTVKMKTPFDVKPGEYVVRLVVRDKNAALLSAENGVVEIR